MKPITRTIGAGEFEHISLPTEFFYLKVTSDTLKIELNEGAILRLEQGDFVEVPSQEGYNLVNESGVAISIELYIGFGYDIRKAPPSQLTVTKNSNLSTLEDVATTAATITILAPANAARESITIIADRGNSDVIRVGDAGNVSLTRGAPLIAGQNITLKTTAAVYGYSALAQAVAMVET